MKTQTKHFRVSLAVSVPMNYEGTISAKTEEEAIAKLIEDLRDKRELGDFDSLNASWDDISEDFDEEQEGGIYAEEIDSTENN